MRSHRPFVPVVHAPVTCRCGRLVQYRADATSGLYYHLATGEFRCADGGQGGPPRRQGGML